MSRIQTRARTTADYNDDLALARRCAAGDRAAAEHLITSNNRRMFRTAWSILKNRAEAEEAVQAAYLLAFASMDRFEGRSALSTWLTRILVNEALGRRRASEQRRVHLEREGVAMIDACRERFMRGSQPDSPEVAIAREQVRKLLEEAVADLPDHFRTVFVLRDVEGLSGAETAEILDIPVATMKTRLLRARRDLRARLAPELATALTGTFPFAGVQCAALTERVLAALPG
ncbi:MAG: RNA polymerase sigma factor [Sphingomicrobium sp.]